MNDLNYMLNALFPRTYLDQYAAVNSVDRYAAVHMPKPVSVVYQKKKIKLTDKDGAPLRDKKTGKRLTKEGNYITVVVFDDGLRVQVAQGEHDQFDLEKALLYAIAKRAYGRLTNGTDKDGRPVVEVQSNGYNLMLKKVVSKAVDQDAVRKMRDEKRSSKPALKAKKPVSKKSVKKSASK